jgi:hypothetical protein
LLDRGAILRESGCNDFGRSTTPRGDIVGLFTPVLAGGVTFSLLLQVLSAVLATAPCTFVLLEVSTVIGFVE